MMLRARRMSAKRVEWKSARRALTSSWRSVGTWQDIVGSVTDDEENGRGVVRRKDQSAI